MSYPSRSKTTVHVTRADRADNEHAGAADLHDEIEAEALRHRAAGDRLVELAHEDLEIETVRAKALGYRMWIRLERATEHLRQARQQHARADELSRWSS
jgi:hypothetical protein